MWEAIANIFVAIFTKYPLQALLIALAGVLTYAVIFVWHKSTKPIQRFNAYRMKAELFRDQMKLWDDAHSELFALFKSSYMTLRKEYLTVEKMRKSRAKDKDYGKMEKKVFEIIGKDGEVDRYDKSIEIVFGKHLVTKVRVIFAENHLADKDERDWESYIEDKSEDIARAFNHFMDVYWWHGSRPAQSSVFSMHMANKPKMKSILKDMLRKARIMAKDYAIDTKLSEKHILVDHPIHEG